MVQFNTIANNQIITFINHTKYLIYAELRKSCSKHYPFRLVNLSIYIAKVLEIGLHKSKQINKCSKKMFYSMSLSFITLNTQVRITGPIHGSSIDQMAI